MTFCSELHKLNKRQCEIYLAGIPVTWSPCQLRHLQAGNDFQWAQALAENPGKGSCPSISRRWWLLGTVHGMTSSSFWIVFLADVGC